MHFSISQLFPLEKKARLFSLKNFNPLYKKGRFVPSLHGRNFPAVIWLKYYQYGVNPKQSINQTAPVVRGEKMLVREVYDNANHNDEQLTKPLAQMS